MVSGRKGAQSGRIDRLLRSLAGTEGDATDTVPGDLAVPDERAATICAAVESTGTVAAAALPEELRKLTASRRRDCLGVAWVLAALAPAGRAAVLVPPGLLADATQGHVQLRRTLVEQGRLHGVVFLAPGCARPRSGAAVLLLGPADPATDLWFCDVASPDELQASADGTEPPCVLLWRLREASASSVLVPRAQIDSAQFDLSPQRHRGADAHANAPAPVQSPQQLLAELAGLEAEIFQGLRDLVGMLKA